MKNFKRIAAVLFAALLIAGAVFASGVSAEEYDGVNYTLRSGKYVLSGVTNSFSGNLVIPSEINGTPVTEIAESALANNTSVCDVTIPASVTKVGKFAFRNCPGITKVVFEESENTVTVLEGAFSGCTNLTGVTLPAGLYSVPTDCFKDCGLTTAKIPEGVNSINKCAFINNTSLEEVFIPSTVETVGEDAFFGCISLKGFYLPNGNDNFKQTGGVLFDADGTEIIQFPLGKDVTSYTVPAGVQYIGRGSFAFSKLKKVTLPEGVEEIERAGFSNSANLESVVLPSTLQIIGENAFYQCKALKSVTIPGSVTQFRDAFYASGLESAVIESGVTSIPNDAFTDCKSLTQVTIPGTVTAINSAFIGCSALEELSIPSSVTSIAADAFNGCDNLTIKADEGSYAVQYAIDHGIPYTLNQTNPDTPDNPDNPDNPVINVVMSVPGNKSAEYRSKVTVAATVCNLPEGCRLVISAGGRTLASINADGRASCTIDEIRETTVFTVKVLNSGNKVLANSDGTALEQEFSVEVNAGFFAKIIAWFKALFRILPEYTFEP